jgi:hypothetical protein
MYTTSRIYPPLKMGIRIKKKKKCFEKKLYELSFIEISKIKFFVTVYYVQIVKIFYKSYSTLQATKV